MSLFRAGLPGLIGLILLLFGLQSLSSGLQSGYAGELADHFRTSSIPNAIGIILLLTAVALARRTRGGLVLGLAVGALGVASGLAVIVLEIPFLQGGGEGASFAVPVMVIVGVWSLLWLFFTWRLWKARSTFSPGWVRADRLVAVALVGIVIVTTGLYVGIGTVQTNAAANAIADDAQARAVVAATGFDVRVVDTGVTPASGGNPAVVNHLSIEIELRSQQQYALAAPPTLCLTSQAMHLDPAYKPGMLCWGLPGPDDSLRFKFATLTVPQDTTSEMITLVGAGSPCPFSPGVWNAELTLAPIIGPGVDGIGPAPAQYSIHATFQVGDGSAPPSSGTPDASEGCLGISP